MPRCGLLTLLACALTLAASAAAQYNSYQELSYYDDYEVAAAAYGYDQYNAENADDEYLNTYADAGACTCRAHVTVSMSFHTPCIHG